MAEGELREAIAKAIRGVPSRPVPTQRPMLRYHVLTCGACGGNFEAIATRNPKKCGDCKPRKFRRGI